MTVMLAVALSASWIVAVVVTARLEPIAALFTPRWQVRALAATSIAFALSTSASALAAAVAAAVTRSLPGGVLAAALATWLLIGWSRAGLHGWRIAGRIRAARIYRCSAMPSTEFGDDVLVVDDATVDAFAVPGRRGVVVITTALAATLPPSELAAVVSHERAHIRGRHHLYTQLVELAACVNPLLRPWCPAVRFAVERDADESAARHDRQTAALAVARAAVLCGPARSMAALGIVGVQGDAVRRVRALQAPQPGRQRASTLLAAGCLVLALIANCCELADVAQDRLVPEPGEPMSALIG